MKALDLHPWRVSIAEATAIQESLRGRVRIQPLDRWPRLVAGADVAYSGATRRIHPAASQFVLAGRKTCTSSTIRVSKRRSRT